jgi:hypothetical protein
MTYYAMSRPATLNAIDVSDPASPTLLATYPVGALDHDMSVSDDGTRGYVAVPQQADGSGNGLVSSTSARSSRGRSRPRSARSAA